MRRDGAVYSYRYANVRVMVCFVLLRLVAVAVADTRRYFANSTRFGLSEKIATNFTFIRYSYLDLSTATRALYRIQVYRIAILLAFFADGAGGM